MRSSRTAGYCQCVVVRTNDTLDEEPQMRKHITLSLCLFGVLALPVAGVGVASAGTGAQDTMRGHVIALVERADAVNFLPAPSGAPIGDRLVFSSHLYDEHGNSVGRDGADCTTTNTDGSAECTISVALADGELTFQGLARGTDNTFAVTGGTGSYRNARGEARAVDVQPGQANLTITLIGSAH
jgi:hypothetical protein